MQHSLTEMVTVLLIKSQYSKSFSIKFAYPLNTHHVQVLDRLRVWYTCAPPLHICSAQYPANRRHRSHLYFNLEITGWTDSILDEHHLFISVMPYWSVRLINPSIPISNYLPTSLPPAQHFQVLWVCFQLISWNQTRLPPDKTLELSLAFSCHPALTSSLLWIFPVSFPNITGDIVYKSAAVFTPLDVSILAKYWMMEL